MDMTKIRQMLSTALFALAAKVAPPKKARKKREQKPKPQPGTPLAFGPVGEDPNA